MDDPDHTGSGKGKRRQRRFPDRTLDEQKKIPRDARWALSGNAKIGYFSSESAPRTRRRFSLLSKRLDELTRIVMERHAGPADTDDADLYLPIIADTAAGALACAEAPLSSRDREAAVTRHVAALLAGCSMLMILAEVSRAVGNPKHWTANEIGVALAVTYEERIRLGLETIWCCDRSGSPRQKQRAKAARANLRRQQKRHAKGMSARSDYEANSISARCEAAGISRERYYRAKRKGIDLLANLENALIGSPDLLQASDAGVERNRSGDPIHIVSTVVTPVAGSKSGDGKSPGIELAQRPASPPATETIGQPTAAVARQAGLEPARPRADEGTVRPRRERSKLAKVTRFGDLSQPSVSAELTNLQPDIERSEGGPEARPDERDVRSRDDAVATSSTPEDAVTKNQLSPIADLQQTIAAAIEQGIAAGFAAVRQKDEAAEKRLAERRALTAAEQRRSVLERAHVPETQSDDGGYDDASAQLARDLFGCGISSEVVADILRVRGYVQGERYDPADAARALALLDQGRSGRDVGLALIRAGGVDLSLPQ